MTLQTRDLLLAKPSFPTASVQIDGEPDISVRSMSALERGEYESQAFATGKVDMRTFKTRLCVFCIVDENGDRVLQDSDLEAFGAAKTDLWMQKVYDAAAKLNGIGQANVDDAEKTSAATDDAGTASN